MKTGLMVKYHELVEFAVSMGYSETQADAILDWHRPEYEVTSVDIDLETLQADIDADECVPEYPAEDVMKIFKALCKKHKVDEFTILMD